MKRLNTFASILFFILYIFTTSLSGTNENVKAKQIKIIRFDKDLLQYINSPSKDRANEIVLMHPALLPALSQTITNTSDQNNILEDLSQYFSHPMLKNIYTDAVNQFNNLTKYEDDLTTVNNIAEKELSIRTLPSFAVHVSGFKENVIYINNIVSLSIDKYMGKDYPAYKGYFKTYQLQQMQPKMIVRDFTRAWLMADIIKTESTTGDMLFEMIEHGKLLYALSVLLPDYAEHDIIGYTAQEYNWCTNNHKKIWTSIIKQNHLYTKDRHIINLYFDDAPTSQIGIRGLPGQIGSWIGFQIVQQYAKETKQPLKTILNIDARTILKDAKYRQ